MTAMMANYDEARTLPLLEQHSSKVTNSELRRMFVLFPYSLLRAKTFEDPLG
jgi:hypothetical protein